MVKIQVQPIKFTASGEIGAAAATDAVISPLTGQAFTPFNSADSVNVPAQGQRIAGFTFAGFTNVQIFNGTDNTGDLVAWAGSPGTYSWPYEVNCDKGLYIAVTGTGQGTIWLV